MNPSDRDLTKGARRRDLRMMYLGVAFLLVVVLGGLFAPHRFAQIVLLATFGNLIGLTLLRPGATDGREPKSRSSSEPWS